MALGGTLAANSVYIICTDAADPAIIAKADLALPYESPVHYNGNDAIAIFGIDGSGNFTVIMDVIGVQSSDPGPTGWNVAGVTGATKDHTLVRKSSLVKETPTGKILQVQVPLILSGRLKMLMTGRV